MRRLLAVPLLIPLLLFGGGLLLLGAPIGAAVHSIIEPTSPPNTTIPSATTDDGSSRTPVCAKHTRYFALTSKHKESRYAFGNPVEARKWDKVLNGMRAYAYQDPAGAGALTAAFDPDVNWGKVNNRPANYVEDHHEWCQEVDRMMDTAQSAEFKTEEVDAGLKSLYMVKSSNGSVPVEIRQGTTTEPGTVAVFTFADRTVRLRLDCHYQPVRTHRFPDVVSLPKKRSAPSPTPTPTPTREPTHTPKPTHSPTPKPAQSHAPTPKVPSQDPAPRGHATVGAGKNKHPGPGKTVAPSDVPTLPSTPRTNPPPPSE